MVKADLVNPPGINGGFSAPNRSRNPTLIQLGVLESAHYIFGSLNKKVGWIEPCWPRRGFVGRVGH